MEPTGRCLSIATRDAKREGAVRTSDVRVGLGGLVRPARWVAGFIMAMMLVIPWFQILRAPRGDFVRHWEFGRRFAQAEFLYEGGLNLPYPPFWAMAHVPLTRWSTHLAQMIAYLLGPICLAGLVLIMGALAPCPAPDQSRAPRFWIVSLTILLTGRFLVRDFQECGVNLALVTLVWLGIWLWRRKRDWLAGVPVGLAIALKCTSAIFLLYVIWRRQWRFAAAIVLATLAFTVAPLAWHGGNWFARHAAVWVTFARRGIAIPDPSIGVLGPEPLANLSLRPALARFLMHLPDGHLARVEHPAYLDLFDLAPATAGRIAKGAVFTLVLIVAGYCRGPIRRRDDPDVVWQLALVALVMLLVSPITWVQHAVAAIPAVYLLVRHAFQAETISPTVGTLATFYGVVVVLLQRGLMGKEFDLVIKTYHPLTWLFLSIIATMLYLQRRLARESAIPATEPE